MERYHNSTLCPLDSRAYSPMSQASSVNDGAQPPSPKARRSEQMAVPQMPKKTENTVSKPHAADRAVPGKQAVFKPLPKNLVIKPPPIVIDYPTPFPVDTSPRCTISGDNGGMAKNRQAQKSPESLKSFSERSESDHARHSSDASNRQSPTSQKGPTVDEARDSGKNQECEGKASHEQLRKAREERDRARAQVKAAKATAKAAERLAKEKRRAEKKRIRNHKREERRRAIHNRMQHKTVAPGAHKEEPSDDWDDDAIMIPESSVEEPPNWADAQEEYEKIRPKAVTEKKTKSLHKSKSALEEVVGLSEKSLIGAPRVDKEAEYLPITQTGPTGSGGEAKPATPENELEHMEVDKTDGTIQPSSSSVPDAPITMDTSPIRSGASADSAQPSQKMESHTSPGPMTVAQENELLQSDVEDEIVADDGIIEDINRLQQPNGMSRQMPTVSVPIQSDPQWVAQAPPAELLAVEPGMSENTGKASLSDCKRP